VPWVRDLVDGPTAARICGYVYEKTWLIYKTRAGSERRDGHHDPRLLPPPAEGESKQAARWELGTLAIWQAVRKSRVLTRFAWPSHDQWYPEIHRQMADPHGAHTERDLSAAMGLSRELVSDLLDECGYVARARSVGDDVLVPIARDLIARMPVRPRPRDLIAACAEAGYKIGDKAAGRVLARAAGDHLLPMEADTLDGLVRPATLARQAGVGVNAIITAMGKCWYCGGKEGEPWHDDGYRAARGEPVPHEFRPWLTPVRRDEWTWLLGAGRVKKVAGLRTPVDSDLRAADRNSLVVKKLP
jgi:hypothetical protein